jgi:hypothetical protein
MQVQLRHAVAPSQFGTIEEGEGSRSTSDPTSRRGPRPRERSSGTTPKLHNGNSALSLCRVAHESDRAAPHYRDELVTRFRAEALVGAIHMSLDGAN